MPLKGEVLIVELGQLVVEALEHSPAENAKRSRSASFRENVRCTHWRIRSRFTVPSKARTDDDLCDREVRVACGGRHDVALIACQRPELLPLLAVEDVAGFRSLVSVEGPARYWASAADVGWSRIAVACSLDRSLISFGSGTRPHPANRSPYP